MAKNARVALLLPGLNAVMKSQGVADELQRRGERIARAAGSGFSARTDQPAHRWVARTRISAGTYEARRAQALDDRLMRALDAGRG